MSLEGSSTLTLVPQGGPITDTTINNTPIGGTTPAAGSFTSVNVTGTAVPNAGIFSSAAGVLSFSSNGINRGGINASGKLLIGGQSQFTGSNSESALYQVQNNTTNAGYLIMKYANDAVGGAIHYLKTRNTSPSTNTVVVSGDDLGRIVFDGADGTGYIAAAQIGAVVAGTPGTNDMPGALVFWTTPDGSATLAERMRIGPDGIVQFRAPSFSANGAVVTTLTGVGPTGAQTTVQEWLTIKNAGGTTRYIPAF